MVLTPLQALPIPSGGGRKHETATRNFCPDSHRNSRTLWSNGPMSTSYFDESCCPARRAKVVTANARRVNESMQDGWHDKTDVMDHTHAVSLRAFHVAWHTTRVVDAIPSRLLVHFPKGQSIHASRVGGAADRLYCRRWMTYDPRDAAGCVTRNRFHNDSVFR